MPPTVAGVCRCDVLRYQKKKDLRHGTPGRDLAIYCAHEAVQDARLAWETIENRRVGVFLGITEHGNVETENEIYEICAYDYDTAVWSHHHNPRTVANNPAGEVTISLGITGPHLTVGAACAAGNAGLIQGVQMLRLGEVDQALAGGVSESIHTFGIFASFQAEGRWPVTPTQPRPAARSTKTATALWWPRGAGSVYSSGCPTQWPGEPAFTGRLSATR